MGRPDTHDPRACTTLGAWVEHTGEAHIPSEMLDALDVLVFIENRMVESAEGTRTADDDSQYWMHLGQFFAARDHYGMLADALGVDRDPPDATPQYVRPSTRQSLDDDPLEEDWDRMPWEDDGGGDGDR